MRCEKCGSDDISCTWHQGRFGAAVYHRCQYTQTQHEGEHLHYSCRRCAYEWTGPLTPHPEDDGG